MRSHFQIWACIENMVLELIENVMLRCLEVTVH
jgi:hypothetical protein